MRFFIVTAFLALTIGSRAATASYDVVIYGGTSGGVGGWSPSCDTAGVSIAGPPPVPVSLMGSPPAADAGAPRCPLRIASQRAHVGPKRYFRVRLVSRRGAAGFIELRRHAPLLRTHHLHQGEHAGIEIRRCRLGFRGGP